MPHRGLEKLSAVQHDIWAHWMRYLFRVAAGRDDGACAIPAEAAQRWQRQVATAYWDLPEGERASDRDQARKVVAALGPVVAVYLDGVDAAQRPRAAEELGRFVEWLKRDEQEGR